MSKITYISDFYVSEVAGGGEYNDDVLIRELDKIGHDVELHKSQSVRILDINNAEFIIISNFCLLPDVIIKQILDKKYIIYEHDHKYLLNRNPAKYKDYLAPKAEIINRQFYKNAVAVLCQSKFHADIVKANLELDNIVSLGGNLWSDQCYRLFEKMCVAPKNNIHAVLNSPIKHKGTKKAIHYCELSNISYNLVADKDPLKFLEKLSAHDTFVFLPETPETLSRVVVEARMMGMSTKTTKNIGAIHEEWFSKKGLDLINYMRYIKQEEIINIVLEKLNA
mgnify:CR=1 FL=1